MVGTGGTTQGRSLRYGRGVWVLLVVRTGDEGWCGRNDMGAFPMVGCVFCGGACGLWDWILWISVYFWLLI